MLLLRCTITERHDTDRLLSSGAISPELRRGGAPLGEPECRALTIAGIIVLIDETRRFGRRECHPKKRTEKGAACCVRFFLASPKVTNG
jgi:hypothetical protein